VRISPGAGAGAAATGGSTADARWTRAHERVPLSRIRGAQSFPQQSGEVKVVAWLSRFGQQEKQSVLRLASTAGAPIARRSPKIHPRRTTTRPVTSQGYARVAHTEGGFICAGYAGKSGAVSRVLARSAREHARLKPPIRFRSPVDAKWRARRDTLRTRAGSIREIGRRRRALIDELGRALLPIDLLLLFGAECRLTEADDDFAERPGETGTARGSPR
jgi:hypothetical protein